MLKYKIVRLMSGVAMALALVSGTPSLTMAETKATEAVNFDPSSVDSFAGAFLAAFTADTSGDHQMAVDLYQTALLFEPDNIQIKERLMINLLLNGNSMFRHSFLKCTVHLFKHCLARLFKCWNKH